MGDLQPNANTPQMEHQYAHSAVRVLNSAKRKRARMAHRKKRTSLVPVVDTHVSRSPTQECQALTTSMPTAGGATGSFPNNQIKYIISKTQGSLPAGASTSPNTKT